MKLSALKLSACIIYEKHLSEQLEKFKDVAKAELEAVLCCCRWNKRLQYYNIRLQ